MISNEYIFLCQIIIIIALSINYGILINWSLVIDEYFFVREILTIIGMITAVKVIDKYL